LISFFRIQTLIDVLTQKIVLGHGSQELNKKYIRNEYQTIINYTDRDPAHKENLIKLDISLCRYKDVYPYKKNVIKVKTPNQFVNASYMHILVPNYFIASQGPKDNTIDDFWTMCFENNVTRILMLCKEFEEGKSKCSDYWDDKMKSELFVNKGTTIKMQNNNLEQKLIRVENKKTGETREFPHLQFKDWPDHSTPNIQNYVQLFQYLFDFIDERNKDNITKNNPVLVHCSAGIGRTGVFLTLYGICNEINKAIQQGQEITFSVFNFVRKLKEMRLFSVENINQYNFIYKFLEEYLKEKNIPKPDNKIIN
jgi:protein tyrosine phosphatase